VHALLRPRGDWSSRDPEWQKSIDAIDGCWPLPNVWLGVSVEDQQRADERIPDLLATLAALRFISAEPLLGPVVLDPLWLTASPSAAFASGEVTAHMPDWTRIGAHALDWVIAGGESGPRRRPVNPDWLRSLRDQCAAAGVAFFAKQLDKVAPIPPDLMVREFPA
jgi:protein gp37